MNAFLSPKTFFRYLTGLAIWLLGWGTLLLLDGQLDLANLSLVLVLTSAVAALWLPVSITLLASVMALMAFNWAFVPPRGTFSIDLHQHAFLLLAMLVVNVIIARPVVSLREQSHRAQAHAESADALRRWGDSLRDAEEPSLLLEDLQNQLAALSQSSVVLVTDGAKSVQQISPQPLSQEQREALEYCRSSGQPLGVGTGHYQELTEIYLPLRGRTQNAGAVMMNADIAAQPDSLAQAQALCDQMGLALERQQMQLRERKARDHAQAQHLRNTFLAAISHDYRTPLATIVGAASSLKEQKDRLGDQQQEQLLGSILDEAERLRRQTSNMLQLARLDGLHAVGASIQSDWESAEEIVGSLLHRIPVARRGRIEVHIQPGLPLIRGDSLLLAQMLENLIDNAFKYGPLDTPVKLFAQVDQHQLVLAVEDAGAGIGAAESEHLFELFQRGDYRQSGSGVGLALCRAIARAHGGELSYRSDTGVSRFECRLPLPVQPAFKGTLE